MAGVPATGWRTAPALLLGVVLLLAGCGGPKFLGLAADEQRTLGELHPGVDSRLAGLTAISRVQDAPYAQYLEHKQAGRVKHELRQGRDLHFAVEKQRNVHFAASGPGVADGAWVTVTDRYRTVVPESTPSP